MAVPSAAVGRWHLDGDQADSPVSVEREREGGREGGRVGREGHPTSQKQYSRHMQTTHITKWVLMNEFSIVLSSMMPPDCNSVSGRGDLQVECHTAIGENKMGGSWEHIKLRRLSNNSCKRSVIVAVQ